ncbi:uncharacterized protein LOC117502346, partial [Thalassophryne amazonica]|uniref:uncharacterized protein LOC117502346 n=1 Tax=Thalassophryne amazonica TaxID=390379 RepID=UPI001470BCB9
MANPPLMLGLHASLGDWLLEFLTGRHQSVRIGHRTSDSITTNTGTPQGCVLSPILTLTSHKDIIILKITDDHWQDDAVYRMEVDSLVSWWTTLCHCSCSPANRGTGWHHKVHQWPTSVHTGRQHKLVIPAEVPDKKFVLVVGASHLRSLADGIVLVPEDHYSFGFMSTPGACADHLRTEVVHAVLPRTPDAVCLIAPGNNLTASTTPKHGGAVFHCYLV